uniref:ganglioside-induced differentiation-associated protein 2 isoform X3 n=1 Tax=Myxine glutinosa TaxID=7769 RepID=UPI00358F64C5
MEPLGVPSRTVCVDTLPRWGSACKDLNSNLASGPENAARLADRSPFTCRPDVNKKIVLWVGEVALLDCQAVVNTTSERLSDRNPVNESVRAHAGLQLHEELRKLQGCRTGEVRVTKGCRLAARFILHTVGPRFDPRYRTAAETQLHHCYRQALLTAMERGLTSLGLCIINTESRGFPAEDAAHIALRTVRRFLENNPEGLSTVVFAVSNAEQALYSSLLPLYFPRSPGEEVRALALLPQEVGDSNGEPLLPDRQIRISDSPLGGEQYLPGHEESDEDFEFSRPGHHPFAQMEGNHDRLRHLSLQAAAKTHKGPVNTILERGYQHWLQQAKTEDLSDIAALRAFYQVWTALGVLWWPSLAGTFLFQRLILKRHCCISSASWIPSLPASSCCCAFWREPIQEIVSVLYFCAASVRPCITSITGI